ncbi:MAG: DUF6285 domain-containing protein [Dehalococcoidia bacterium]
MQDRPTQDELLVAVERFLDEQIVPHVEGARGFHARVAANVIRTVRRELEREEAALDREWEGLDALLGVAQRPGTRPALREALAQRNEELCRRIRETATDRGVIDHVRATVRDKLLVTNPGWLGEDA